MSEHILIAYASRTGTTTGVAEAIGDTLKNHGVQVDVRAMQDIDDCTPFRAVVAGSAIQNRQWLPEALQFIHTHRAVLVEKPLATFLVCMTLAMKNADQYRSFVLDFLQPVRAQVNPVSEGLFAGALDISKVPSFSDRFKFRLSVLFRVWSEGDHRDWNAIHSWTESIYPLLIQ